MGRLDFTRKERITLDRDVERALRSGRRCSDEAFVLSWAPRPGDPSQAARLALRVPGTACGAVGRNRLRRLLRESFRQDKPFLKTGVDLVLSVRPSAFSRSRPGLESVRERWTALCRKAGLREP
jgi:ribonuclease P protein component